MPPIDDPGISPIHPRDKNSRPLAVHPALFAAYPVVYLYSRNLDDVAAREVVRPLTLSVFAALAAVLVFLAATRHVRKAALAASALVLAFFSYGHLVNVLPPGLSWVATSGCATLLLTGLALILRSSSDFALATRVANVAAVALLAPSVVTVAMKTVPVYPRSGHSVNPGSAGVNLGSATPDAAAKPTGADRPDIYYIILDAYAGQQSLGEFYHFDNAPFIDGLRRRGFVLPRSSRSNYDQTGYSLASTLNMRFLDDLPPSSATSGTLGETLHGLIDRNRVAVELRARGYRYLFVGSGEALTRAESADRVYADDSEGPPPESFERQVFGLTALDADPDAWVSEFDQHRSHIRAAFRELPRVAREASPKFVLVHIAAPHPPFVFTASGMDVDPRGPYIESDGSQLLQRLTKDQYRAGYVAQLQFVNQQTLRAIDGILASSSRPPLIILQGDHGSRMNLDWSSLDRTDLREPYTILNACLAPPEVQHRLYDGITSVNTFRVLLTALFGAKLPTLPDRSYYSTADDPLNFADVTDRITRAWQSGTTSQGKADQRAPARGASDPARAPGDSRS